MEPEPLISATLLETNYGINKRTAYELARLRKIPSCKVGAHRRGVRFKASEVLTALRQSPLNEGNTGE